MLARMWLCVTRTVRQSLYSDRPASLTGLCFAVKVSVEGLGGNCGVALSGSHGHVAEDYRVWI